MRFDLTDLRLFVNVIDAGTITGGARATHMTLASASERILKMEAALGSALLERTPRGVTATAAGRAVAHHARLVRHQLDCLQDELRDDGHGIKGHVRMLCNTSALSEHLPDLLASFLALHPRISVDLEEGLSDEIVDAVRDRRCELGLVSDAADLTGLMHFAFREDPLVLVLSREHPLASRQAAGSKPSRLAGVALSQVVDEPFVGLLESSALHGHVARQARLLGKRIDYRVRVRSLESLCRMVGQGIGLGIVPRAVALRLARSAGIAHRVLTDAWARRQLVLCMRDIEALAPHVAAFARHLLDAAAPSPRSTTKDQKRRVNSQ